MATTTARISCGSTTSGSIPTRDDSRSRRSRRSGPASYASRLFMKIERIKNKQIILVRLASATVSVAPHARAQSGSVPAKLQLIKVRDDLYVISNVAVPVLVTALITNAGVLL